MAAGTHVHRDDIREFIAEYRLTYGYAPSVREIAENQHMSVSNAFRVLKAMVEDGEMRAVAGRARTWSIV